MAYYSRSAWTTVANGASSIKQDQVHTTVHYPGFGNSSVKTANWTREQCFKQIRAWRSMHVPKTYKEIAYNFFVLPTGDFVEGRGFRQNGANGTGSANRAGLSVQVLIGDTEALNSKFLKGLADCFAHIRARYPNAMRKIYGHQHWVSTSCPGKAIMAAINNGTINGNMKGSVSVPSGGTSAPKPVASSNVWETSARIKGMSKETVKSIQTKLVKAGYSVGKSGVDGSYKNDTVNAVKEFQKKNGLTVDGVAGPNTVKKLDEAVKSKDTKPAAKPAAKPSTPAKKPAASKAPAFPLPKGFVYGNPSGPVSQVSGKTSNSKATKDVVKDARGKWYSKGLKQWQAQMKKRGWTIDVDGRYGKQTERVATQFKKNKKLGNDGRIGPVTWAAAWDLKVV